MARKEIVNQIVKLYQKLGGNVSDVLGTKTNVIKLNISSIFDYITISIPLKYATKNNELL